MSASEPPGDRPARKRMLPSVSDVVQQLAKLHPKAEPSLVFKAAREVCAEELNRVKQGHESAAVAALVERAAQRLAPLLGLAPAPPAAPAAPAPVTHPTATVAPADSVFEETTGALDLRWDRERSEPLADAMTTMAGDAFDVAPPPPQSYVLTEPAASVAHEDIGMGEDTFTNLQKEAKGVDLGSVLPHKPSPYTSEPTERMDASHRPPFEEPESGAPEYGRREPTAREWSSVVHEEPSGTSRVLLYSLVAVVALAAGFGAYTYFGVGRSNPGPFTNVPHRARRTPAPSTSSPAPATTSSTAPVATSAPSPAKLTATPPPAIVVKPAPTAAITLKPAATATVATRPAAAVPTPAPAIRPTVAPAVRPTAATAARATVAPKIVAAPTPVPVPVRAVAPPPLNATTTNAAGAQKGRAASLATKDWAGKAPVYTLHFSSYKDRASADKEAAQLGKKYGHPGHGVEVDLGDKGTWYRVVVGEFATVDEARAFRDELLAQGTKGVGFVYRLEGK